MMLCGSASSSSQSPVTSRSGILILSNPLIAAYAWVIIASRIALPSHMLVRSVWVPHPWLLSWVQKKDLTEETTIIIIVIKLVDPTYLQGNRFWKEWRRGS